MEFLQNISDIKFLNLSYNRIQKVPSCLQRKSQLIEINFKKNKILSIEKNIFDDLPGLELVNFSENLLKELPENLVEKCCRIRNIDFSFNKIKKIENIGIAGKSIQKFNFSRNILSAIDLNFFNDARINVIDLRNFITIDEINFHYILNYIINSYDSNEEDILSILLLIGFQDTVKTTSRNQEKSIEKLFDKLEQVSKRNWTFIDFILSLDIKQEEIYTCLTKLNKTIQEIKIKNNNQRIFFNRIKSNESFLKLCRSENKELLKSFLPIEHLREYFSDESKRSLDYSIKDLEDKITSFISIDDMYKFDHASAFKIAAKDENEETLIVLIYLFKFMEQVAKTNRSLNFKYEKIREQFFDKCLHYIFEYKCQGIIDILLYNNEIPMSFFDLPDQNELLYDPRAYKQKRLCFVKILSYIKRNKNYLSLQNAKIAATFEQEWNSLPKILYHFNLKQIKRFLFRSFIKDNLKNYKAKRDFDPNNDKQKYQDIKENFRINMGKLEHRTFELLQNENYGYCTSHTVRPWSR
ncbi:insulin-like growth factor-binding complex acid labile subunit [Brachionus plicatilis]|uniref:Insulin-like growth factor-binding complex acid labile subunit n=1 Tax=Brachionus plicatilis TaxID=10195 RepID=A0A3M7SIQ0_BRAPC|nr:insulin-like growth factor-binding complex acid labile subunit [Brachionus plicatilis]